MEEISISDFNSSIIKDSHKASGITRALSAVRLESYLSPVDGVKQASVNNSNQSAILVLGIHLQFDSIPIAVGVIYPLNGFHLNSLRAGEVMSMSSKSVLTNSLRLRKHSIN